MNDIYQQIWNSDRHKFLVSPRNSQRKWLDPDADILLDEQIAAFGRRDLDLAPDPLFYRVNETKLQTIPTYISLIKLLDNYSFDHQKSEIVTKPKKIEIEEFIQDIFQTNPIKLAQAYINQELKIKLSTLEFRQQLKTIWFDLYTNYFGNQLVKDASGFEHIFVGEGKYDLDENTDHRISGYHSWVKFYLDEKQQRANYLGHNYELQGNVGVDNPYVVTLQMLLKDENSEKKRSPNLFKKKGCFFVGTSPECDIAMGTVAYYENLVNYKFNREKRRTVINGTVYDLALYRNLKQDGSRGNYIRSFYPIYLGNKNNNS